MKGGIPCLAQANVCEAIVVAEGYVQVAVNMQGTAIEADVFLESLEEESAVVDGGFYLARHGKMNTSKLGGDGMIDSRGILRRQVLR